MQKQLEEIRMLAEKEIAGSKSEQEIETLRIKYLGKKGCLTDVLKQMAKLSAKERPLIGKMANQVRTFIEEMIEKRNRGIKKITQEERLRAEKIDVTLPGKCRKLGTKHPITTVLEEIEEVFIGMGFNIVEGPEIELDYYNFEALNIPKSHPARDEKDTFYITDTMLLRTETSTVQVRTMEKASPPIRIISPGRVYRVDEVDATHSPIFHQIEGLVVDKNVTFADLKGTLEKFVEKFYGASAAVRFRPHYFPFTEPSAEMDIRCFHCQGSGCKICKGEGWIEILGCGMVHRKVFENCKINPQIYSGFAFALGLERLVMYKYSIKDIRFFYENDVRFLKQF
jgi:phenylalanyl-tRNA synthetase alpha chain